MNTVTAPPPHNHRLSTLADHEALRAAGAVWRVPGACRLRDLRVANGNEFLLSPLVAEWLDLLASSAAGSRRSGSAVG